jgi:hypothetical protein
VKLPREKKKRLLQAVMIDAAVSVRGKDHKQQKER